MGHGFQLDHCGCDDGTGGLGDDMVEGGTVPTPAVLEVIRGGEGGEAGGSPHHLRHRHSIIIDCLYYYLCSYTTTTAAATGK